MKSALFLFALPLTLLACGEEEKKVSKAETCSLSLDSIEGSEWLYLKEEVGKESRPDFKSRLKFYKEGGNLKAKYTVGSFADMYEYNCNKKTNAEGKEEIICKSPPDYEQWCETMIVNNKKCSLKMFQKLDDTIVDSDELKKGVEKAISNHKAAKEKGGSPFMVYQNQHNSLMNKLQGVLYASVDKEKCLFKVTDHYITYNNGKKLEDSNPNSTNTFVKNEAGELLWEDCDTPQLFDTKMAEFPEKPEEVQFVLEHEKGSDIHFWLLYADLRYVEEGCTYSYDIFHNYQKIQSGLTPETVEISGKKELRWGYSQKFDKVSSKDMFNPSVKKSVDVIMMRTKKSCDGKDTVVTACNNVSIK